MKSAVFRVSLCALVLALIPANSHASTLYWAGTGAWDTASAVWHLDSPGGTLVTWSNGGNHDAVIDGAGGTITLSTGITARSITFVSGAYTLQGSTLTFTAGNGSIDVASGITAAVNSVIAGIVGLTKTGDGTLVLAAANTYSGSTAISAGTLQIAIPAAPAIPQTLWIADSLSGADGSAVTLWADSIQGKQATTYNVPPTLNAANLLNGHKSVKFTGAQTQALQVAGEDCTISGANDFSIAVVFKAAAAGVGSGTTGTHNWFQNAGIIDGEISGIFNDWGIGWSSNPRIGAGIGNTDRTCYSATLSLNTLYVAIYTRQGANVALNVNGAVTSISNAGTAARAVTRMIFGGQNTTNNYFTGEIAEVQFFNSQLTSQTVASLSTILRNKYNGLSVIPDSSGVAVAAGATFDVNGAIESIATLSGSGSVSLGSGTLTASNSFDSVFDGIISGSGSFTKAGASTLTLSNTNTFTGTTTVTAGRLRAGVPHPIASSFGLVLQNNGEFDLNGNHCLVGSLAGAVGTKVLMGSINGTTLSVGSNNTSTFFGGVTSGTGGIEKTGNGTFSLASAQTYSGSTVVSGGTLKLFSAPQDAVAFYSFDDVAGATVRNGGTAGSAKDATLTAGATVSTGGGGRRGEAMQIPNTGNQQTNGARLLIALTGGKGIDLAGGNWTASAWFNTLFPPRGGANANGNWRTIFRGASADHQTLINDTTTVLGAWQSNGSGFFASSPAYDMSSVSTGWHMITAVGSGASTTFYIDGVQVGASSFKSTADIGVIGNSVDSLWQPFSRLIDDVYIYQRALNSAEVAGLYDSTSVLPTATTVILSGPAVLDLNGVKQVVGSITGTSATQILLGGGTLTTGSDNSSFEYAGVISQSGNLTKTGSGALTLSSSNTYSGTTTVVGAGSRVIVTHPNALGTASGNGVVQSGAQLLVNLASPATISVPLTLNGDGGGSGALVLQQNSITWDASVTLANNAMISTPADSTLMLLRGLSGAGGLSKNGPGTLAISGAVNYSGATSIFGGTLELNGTFNSSNAVSVTAGSTLKPGAAGMTMSSLAVNDNGVLCVRIPTAVNAPKLTVSGTAALGAASVLQLDLASYPDGVGGSFPILDAQSLPNQFGSLNKVNDAGASETTVVDYVNGARQTAVLTLNDVPTTTVAAANASAEFKASSQTLTLTAAVTSTGGPINVGTVSFQLKNGASDVGSAVTSPTVVNGAASVTYTIPAATPAGPYTINATYSGATNFKPSSESTKTLTITRAAATVTPANLSVPYSFADQSTAISVQVTSLAGVVNEGTVTIQLKSGVQNIGSAATSNQITNGSTTVNYTIPGGTQQGAYTIEAAYSGGVNFAPGSNNTKTLTVQKATPVITWNAPSDIAYGTALGAIQLNASVGGVPGTFTYNPTTGTVLAVGNGQQLVVIFTPNDSANYSSAQKTVSINVTKAILTVTADNQSKLVGAPNPPLTASYSGFVNGETAAVLIGSPALSTAVNAGTPVGNYPINVTQGTLNAANYSFSFINGTMSVTNQPSFLTLSAPNVPYTTTITTLSGKISFGVTGIVNITLNGVSKSATIDASGSFSVGFSTGTLDLGTYPIQYSYPGNGTIAPISDARTLTIIKGTPTITWANPADVPFGTPLSITQLNATANTAGTFAYNPPVGTVLTKGTHQLSTIFSPTDTTRFGSVNASVTLIVGLAQAVITWATPADISYGTTLSDAQLNATADVAGTFTYNPPAGTLLNAGEGQMLSLTFTPEDIVNYAVLHVNVFINVLKAEQTIAFAQISDQEIGGSALTLIATASSNLPVTISLVSGNATLQGTTLTLLGLGAITLRAEQAGDANFNAAPTVEQTFHVIIIPPHLTSVLSANGTQGQPFTFTLTASGTNPVTFESGTLPAGLSLNANTGEISGTPTASGAFQIAVTARNGGGTERKTLTLVFANSGGGENHAPKFTSGVLATPNPITVNLEVAFSASASDEDGDSIAVVWDFGDGAQGSGSTTTHRYTTAGIFAAKVTITDGVASDYLNVTIVVNGSVIPPDQYKQYVVSKLGLKFNFAKPNTDSLSISGTIPVPAAFSPEGKVVKFESGELEREWTLDKKATSSDKAFKLTGKFAKDGTLTGSPAKFAIALKNQDLFTALSPLGFINDNTPKGMIVRMPVILVIEGTGYLATVDVKYAAKKGKSGSGKK